MLHYVPYDKNSQQSTHRVFHQYPIFHWVYSTHFHRGIIYKERDTHIPWYPILCIIVIFFKIICGSSAEMLCPYLANCWLYNYFAWRDVNYLYGQRIHFCLNKNHYSHLLLKCMSWLSFSILDQHWSLVLMLCLVYKQF